MMLETWRAALVATWNPASSAGYYLQTAYYLGGHEPAGAWYAPAGDFGIRDESVVDPYHFENLFSGRDRDGNLLAPNHRIDRTGAFDMTYSAPRSIALIWALGTVDQRLAIEKAHLRAVRSSLNFVQAEACRARRGRGGSRIENVALTAAIFQHGESRPAEHADGAVFPDPNLHCHAVIMNMATRSDGTVGALHSKILRGFKMAAGAAYHAALAHEMALLGYSIDRIGRNGIFEIKGIADDDIQYFSARRTQIENELAQAGMATRDDAALAAAVSRRSRKAKAADTQDRHTQWAKIARARGLDTLPFPGATPDLALNRDGLSGWVLFAQRLDALPRALTETTSVVERREVFRAVAEALVGTGLCLEHVDAGVAHLVRQGLLLELGSDALGQSRYSTAEMIAIEREVVATAERLIARSGIGIDPATVKGRCDGLGLNPEQAAAAIAATGTDRVVVIEGAPGTGKTTALTPIVEAWRAAGFEVLGAATAWRTANSLRDDLGIPARATASWLVRAEMGQPILTEKSLLIVDEAGLLSSREMHAILRSVESADARLLLVGDRQQLQAIGAGAGLALVVRATEASRIGTVVRQRDGWLRAAIADFGRGRAAEALKAFHDHGHLVQSDGPRAALRAVVDSVEEQLLRPDGGSALIIARTNLEVAAISDEVRARLKQAGIVSGPEVVLNAVTPSGHASRITLARGDRIRFLMRNDRLGVVNGTTAIIRHIASSHAGEQDDALLETEVDGRIVRFNAREFADTRGRVRLGWAYASTVYGSQGMTVDQAAVLLTPGFDRHHIYVAASRSRGSTMLVVDQKALNLLVRERSGSLEALAAATWQERCTALAARLTIANIKETTFVALTSAGTPIDDGLGPRNVPVKVRQPRVNTYEL